MVKKQKTRTVELRTPDGHLIVEQQIPEIMFEYKRED